MSGYCPVEHHLRSSPTIGGNHVSAGQPELTSDTIDSRSHGIAPGLPASPSALLQRAQIEGRADDTEDIIRRRQEIFVEQTAPLIDAYRNRGLIVEVDGLGEVDEVTKRILSACDSSAGGIC